MLGWITVAYEVVGNPATRLVFPRGRVRPTGRDRMHVHALCARGAASFVFSLLLLVLYIHTQRNTRRTNRQRNNMCLFVCLVVLFVLFVLFLLFVLFGRPLSSAPTRPSPPGNLPRGSCNAVTPSLRNGYWRNGVSRRNTVTCLMGLPSTSHGRSVAQLQVLYDCIHPNV